MNISIFGSGFLDFIEFCFSPFDPEANIIQFALLFIIIIGFISIFISFLKERG